MHVRRFVAIALFLIAPTICFAQEPDTGTGDVVTASTGATIFERLDALATGGLPLDRLAMETNERSAWTAEVKRYQERSAELRSRCGEQLRSANRDEIVGIATQCLRSDLLLETGHRRKQRDALGAIPGVDESILQGALTGIDAWLDASSSVVDGIDAGVFATVEPLKEAKRKLHETYRAPMLHAFTRVRASAALSVVRSVAASVRDSLGGETHGILETLVPCLESAHASLADAASPTGKVSSFRSGIAELRSCIVIANDARDA